MFSQTTEYALRAMAWLALSPEVLVPTSSLAEHTKVPEHYLAKVLQQLAAAKLIKGRRGVGGGYKLARPANQIAVTDVIRTVCTLERIRTCPLGIESHGSNLCPLHRLMDEVAKAALDRMEGQTLQSLIDQPGANTPLCETKPTVAVTVDGRAKK